jgi:catechol 2,3-dioxygenase-like lactoylglutathione lyase family enzyme
MPGTAKLGIVRQTNKLEEVVKFYRDGLGLAELHRLENQGRVDGVILGLPGAPCYLEFTDAHGHLVRRAASADNGFVVCLSNEGEWTEAVARMGKSGYNVVPASNPFCSQHELTFEDPDGYRVVLQHADWER